MRLLATLLLLTLTPVQAQGTGTITGRVTSASTGEALPGANVLVEGTGHGAASDTDGNYRIIGVPVGAYVVEARYIGSDTVLDSVVIRSGYTTHHDFALTTPPLICDTLAGVDDPEERLWYLEHYREFAEVQGIGPPGRAQMREIQIWDTGSYGYATLLRLLETEEGWEGSLGSVWPINRNPEGSIDDGYRHWLGSRCATFFQNDSVAACQLRLDPLPDWDAVVARLEGAQVWTLPDESTLPRVECEGVVEVGNGWTLTTEVYDGTATRSYHYRAPRRSGADTLEEARAAEIHNTIWDLWRRVPEAGQ